MRWREAFLALNSHAPGRILTALVLAGLAFKCYWFLNDHLQPRLDLMTALDHAIPFMPWTIVVYQSFFLMIIFTAWACDGREFVRTLKIILYANIVSYVFFIAFTSHYPRPELLQLENPLWKAMFGLVYQQDAPGNTFPSIHVAVTVLLALRMRMRRLGLLWLPWASLVCLSTLTVKQHYVIDVLGGIVVALSLNWWEFDRRVKDATPL